LRSGRTASSAAHGESGQLNLGLLPVGRQLRGLLIGQIGRFRIIQALKGDGAIEPGLGRFIDAKSQSTVDFGKAFGVPRLGDQTGAPVDIGLAEIGLRPTVLFDTELAGRLLGREKVGLAALVAAELGDVDWLDGDRPFLTELSHLLPRLDE
jgi:hypothetical protein